MRTSEIQRNTILSAAQRQGIGNPSELADKAMIPRPTLRRKLREPGKLTVYDLMRIDRVAKFNSDEWPLVIKGKA